MFMFVYRNDIFQSCKYPTNIKLTFKAGIPEVISLAVFISFSWPVKTSSLNVSANENLVSVTSLEVGDILLVY